MPYYVPYIWRSVRSAEPSYGAGGARGATGRLSVIWCAGRISITLIQCGTFVWRNVRSSLIRVLERIALL